VAFFVEDPDGEHERLRRAGVTILARRPTFANARSRLERADPDLDLVGVQAAVVAAEGLLDRRGRAQPRHPARARKDAHVGESLAQPRPRLSEAAVGDQVVDQVHLGAGAETLCEAGGHVGGGARGVCRKTSRAEPAGR